MTLHKVSYCLFHSLQKVEYDEECDTKLEEQCETTQVNISIVETAQVIIVIVKTTQVILTVIIPFNEVFITILKRKNHLRKNFFQEYVCEEAPVAAPADDYGVPQVNWLKKLSTYCF